MLGHLLGFPDHPLIIFLTISIGGLIAFFSIATLSYLYFFVVRRDRYHSSYEPTPKETKRAMFWSAMSVLGNAALIAPIHWLMATGHSQIYWDIGEHGWLWLGTSILLLLVVTETMIYWIHRALHTKPLYKPVHWIHHSFKVPDSYVGVAFNPFDSFMQGLPHHLCAFLFPINGFVYLISVGLVTVWAVSIHDRVSFVRWPFLNNTGHHTLHHWYETYNFGQYTTFWDRLCGTHRSPFEGCEDIPEGILSEAWQNGEVRGEEIAQPTS